MSALLGQAGALSTACLATVSSPQPSVGSATSAAPRALRSASLASGSVLSPPALALDAEGIVPRASGETSPLVEDSGLDATGSWVTAYAAIAAAPLALVDAALSGYALHRACRDYQASEQALAEQSPGMARFDETRFRFEQAQEVLLPRACRLGRDAIDVMTTVKAFKERGIKLVVLQLCNLDLTSASGELMVHVIAAVARW